ncbi:hypothetical protein FPQ18DRAFT_395417 [Pyronema domesticum]|nr:hypothetical protein FPQ18DRAFT_395417 [Pyronema domesticum]
MTSSASNEYSHNFNITQPVTKSVLKSSSPFSNLPFITTTPPSVNNAAPHPPPRLHRLRTFAQAAGIIMCYNSNFASPFRTEYTGSGGCINVSRDWNDHIFSARATNGYCINYENSNCGGAQYATIDVEGWRGLPQGHLTSSFRCYD